ncbi:hypothetical protein KAH81_00475 [bacterium]|nr:hypothetical protein [bacterium]
MKPHLLTILIILTVLALSAFAQTDSAETPVFHAELSLVALPDSLVFTRSDTSLLQFNWAVRFRIFKDSLNAPELFNLGIKYIEEPGEGSFKSTVHADCSWALERKSPEGTFYRIGDMNLVKTDSSWLMTAEVSAFFLEGTDSIQFQGVTDCAPEGRFKLRDITDYGSPGNLLWDKVGDISDRRFDIRFVRGELTGWPPPEKE